MPTIEQIRAARALLDWSQSDLAKHADLSQTGIARIENGTNQPNSQTLNKIKAAFENAGIEFLGRRGVQIKAHEIKIFNGHEGFIEFLNDVYNVVVNNTAGNEIVVNNVSESQFLFWEKDFVHVHQARMAKENVKYRIIVEEGDTNLVASNYAHYRSVPSETFSSISYYVYGDRAALIDFGKNNVVVYLIQSQAIADFYREEFEKVWIKAKPV
jgi:transcriptional regulator with XRE-family HTH domain